MSLLRQDPARAILHVDMDAFFAAVEVLDDPSLAGLPLVVGGAGGRGVVASCSYEARRYGVRSAMPSAHARRRCPQAVFRPPRHDRYQEVSRALHEVLLRFTPLVEGIALDEAFLDVTGAQRLFGPGPAIGRKIRQAVADELRLSCSVGLATTKLVAKLASEAAKPRAGPGGVEPGPGLVVVEQGEELAFLQPLPVEALWGVGPATAGRLRSLGITTVGGLAATPPAVLEGVAGRQVGRHLHQLAHGVDSRPVEPDRAVKSVGHEETFAVDRWDRDGLRRELLRMSDAVASRLRRAGVAGRTVTVKVRMGDFATVTRSVTVAAPVDTAASVARLAAEAFDRVELDRGVRLLGVAVASLEPGGASEQLRLDFGGGLSSPARTAPASSAAAAVDAVRERFGAGAVGPAGSVERWAGAIEPGASVDGVAGDGPGRLRRALP